MNFIENIENGIEVELKYCERCGGLFLRPKAADLVFCSICKARRAAASLPGERPKRGTTRRSKRTTLQLRGQAEQVPALLPYLQAMVASEARSC